jgi:tRNA A-37 threonylcarbamoyl transferase component Bud32
MHGPFVELTIAGRAGRSHSIAGPLTCLARPDLVQELSRTYEEHDWVYDAMAGREGVEMLRGRRPVVAGQLGSVPAVVKRLSHGGSMTNLWKDRFLSSRRFRNHIPVTEFLLEHGIDTPPVLFAAWRRIRGLVRGEVGFEKIEGGVDADQFFFGNGHIPEGWREEARKIGETVASLHRIEFVHQDMNLMNFYLAPDGRVYVLDLDKSSLDGSASASLKRINLARLERSIRKQGRLSPADYVEAVVRELHDSYAAANG